MDTTLDDIIKMSKATSNKSKKQLRIPQENCGEGYLVQPVGKAKGQKDWQFINAKKK
ncbi:hypothetical protein PTKIN_Ptkin10aG0061400 [Pterospermum kingtungense]